MMFRLVRPMGAAALLAAAPAFAQQGPPLRQIDRVTAVAGDSFAAVTAAVEVGNGRVYVNDILARRVLLYDSALGRATVIADSDGTAGEAYGNRPGTLLKFRGDSALFISPASLSMLVLGPDGRVARVMAMPPGGGGMPALIGSIFGTPGFDAAGRLVFFSPVRMVFTGPPPSDGPMHLSPPDSALVVRFDFTTRTLDTVGTIRIPRTRSSMSRDDQGRPRMTLIAIPPATVDDWAVTSDGRVAIVRGRDYHVDWLNAQGAWTATPRLPYAWERLDDDAKTALIDSVQRAMQEAMDSMPARMARGGAAGGPMVTTRETRSGGPGGPGGAAPMVAIVTVGPGGGDRAATEHGAGGGGGPPAVTTTNIMVPTVVRAEPADVPDYRPPFRQGAVRADLDGNLWIRTDKQADGRPIYDVVSGRGELVDRVQLPPFRTIAGFGRGVVYLGVRDTTGVMRLERAPLR